MSKNSKQREFSKGKKELLFMMKQRPYVNFITKTFFRPGKDRRLVIDLFGMYPGSWDRL